MANQDFFTGSICLDDLLAAQQTNHSAFNTAKNGKVYVNLFIGKKKETDEHKNTHGIRLNSVKDERQNEPKIFIGNVRIDN